MAHYISCLRLLAKVVAVSCLFRSAIAQANDQDKINFAVALGWNDLPGCITSRCFPGQHFDGGGELAVKLGCSTNKCLCRPSYLYQGLQYIVDCARTDCQNLDDVNLAHDSLEAYCHIKGYTSIEAPISDFSTTPGGYYITATTTVYKSDATRRIEAGFAALPRVSTKKQEVDYILWAAPIAVMLLISTLYLFSVAFGLRALLVLSCI